MLGITKKEIISNSISAIAGGMVTVLGALALGYIQSREPVLEYIRNDSPPLKDKDKATSIYFASIYNVGNKEAENVDCILRIPKAKILSHGFTPHAIKYEYKEESDSATIHINVLNPNEAVTIQLLATSDSELPEKAEVDVRAKGVNGTEKGAPTTQQNSSLWGQISGYFSMAILFGVAFALPTATINMVNEVMSLLGKKWELVKNRYKVKIKLDGDGRIKVTILEGLGKSSDAIVVIPYGKHPIIGASFEDLKKLGDGTHVIYKDKYA